MRRSLALIAVVAAVAVAAVIVIAGMNSGGAGDADATTGDAPGALPSGHPSIAATDEATADPHAADQEADVSMADDDMLDDLEARRDDSPGDAQVLVDLGEAYFLRQRLQQAEQAYDEALALDPENTAAQVGLAMVWHADGDSKRAEKALADIVEAHPDDQDAHYTLAIVYFSAGRVDEAKQEWQTAARIDPGTTTGRRSQSFVDLLEGNESAAPSTD